MGRTLLAFSNLHPVGLEPLEDAFEIVRLWKEPDPEAVIRKCRNEIVAIVGAPGRSVTRKLIEALPNLEIISNFAVGTDNIDLAAARERSIAVTNTPDVLTADTADTAISLMLAVARRVVEADAFVRVGKWHNGPFQLGASLAGKKVGIVGLGRIGAAIARRAEGFEMDIVYFGRAEKPGFVYRYYNDLAEMAGDVDFLVLSCAGGAGTRHLVDAAVLKALGPAGFLVNVARGSVVDEEALLIALRNKFIAGAGLDVYENEPQVPEALFSMDNVVLLPHIGSATVETRSKMAHLVIGNILAHFRGEPLKTPVAA